MDVFFNTVNDFVVEYKRLLSEYDISEFSENLSVMGEAVTAYPVMDKMITPELYLDCISRTLEHVDDATADRDAMISFFTSIAQASSLDSKNIAIHLHDENQIQKIRPEYLGSVSAEYNAAVKAVLNKTIKMKDVKSKYINGEYFPKLRKQLVKTDMEISDMRNLLVLEDPNIISVDTMCIRTTIIPYLVSYDDNMKTLKNIAISTKGQITTTYNEIAATNATIEEMINSGKIDRDMAYTLRYLKYNFLRNYMNCCAYLTGMVVRKIAIKNYNMMSYANLVRTITDYFPEERGVLHEAVLNGDLSDIEDSELLQSMIDNDLSIIRPHIDKVVGLKKMDIANTMAFKHNRKILYNQNISIDEYSYDMYPYKTSGKSILDIAKSLVDFSNNMFNPHMTFDEMVESANLTDSFVNRYNGLLDRIESMEYYNELSKTALNKDGAVSMSLFNDLTHYEENIATISNQINKLYRLYDKVCTQYDAKPADIDENTYYEVKEYLIRLKSNLDDYTLRLTKRFISRLDNMTECLVEHGAIEPFTESDFDIAHDYSLEFCIEELDHIAANEENIFESMLKEYSKAREKITRGVTLMYEDTEVVSGDDAKMTASAGDSESGDSKPKSGGISKIVTNVIQWVKRVITKFMEKSKSFDEKNRAYLDRIRKEIGEGKAKNITIQTPKYDKFNEVCDTYITNAQAAISAIPQKLPTGYPWVKKEGDEEAKKKALVNVQTRFFKNIPQNTTGDNFNNKVINYAYWGDSNSHTYVKYTGEDATKELNRILDFCSNYSSFSEDLNKKLNDLAKTTSDKVTSFIPTEEPGETTTNEEGKPVKKPTKKEQSFTDLLSKTVDDYVAGVLTVSERRYLDYMSLLKKLFPNTVNTNDKGKEDTSEENNENNENNNEE